MIGIDDDACTLYEEAGRGVELPPQHASFALAEQAQWRESLSAGRVVVAVTDDDVPIGFAALGFVDGEPHLQQVSVRRAWMGRGVGHALLRHAIAWGNGTLWLTTYADIPWNAPMYARHGFVQVDASRCGNELRQILTEERSALPSPEHRVAMVRRVS